MLAAAKSELYRELCAEVQSLVAGEPDPIANLGNAAALLYHSLPDLNWAGFYLLKPGLEPGARAPELVVGPFQGRPACTRIAWGRGVCGTAAARRETVIVADVHAFSDHIACDSDSNSEIVVPLLQAGAVVGVLDLDSPLFSRFDADDRDGLEAFVKVLLPHVALSAVPA